MESNNNNEEVFVSPDYFEALLDTATYLDLTPPSNATPQSIPPNYTSSSNTVEHNSSYSVENENTTYESSAYISASSLLGAENLSAIPYQLHLDNQENPHVKELWSICSSMGKHYFSITEVKESKKAAIVWNFVKELVHLREGEAMNFENCFFHSQFRNKKNRKQKYTIVLDGMPPQAFCIAFSKETQEIVLVNVLWTLMVDYLSDYKKRVFDDKYVGWKILTDGTTNYLRFTVEEELMTKIRNNLNNGQIECKTALFNHPDKKYRIDGNFFGSGSSEISSNQPVVQFDQMQHPISNTSGAFQPQTDSDSVTPAAFNNMLTNIANITLRPPESPYNIEMGDMVYIIQPSGNVERTHQSFQSSEQINSNANSVNSMEQEFRDHDASTNRREYSNNDMQYLEVQDYSGTSPSENIIQQNNNQPNGASINSQSNISFNHEVSNTNQNTHNDNSRLGFPSCQANANSSSDYFYNRNDSAENSITHVHQSNSDSSIEQPAYMNDSQHATQSNETLYGLLFEASVGNYNSRALESRQQRAQLKQNNNDMNDSIQPFGMQLDKVQDDSSITPNESIIQQNNNQPNGASTSSSTEGTADTLPSYIRHNLPQLPAVKVPLTPHLTKLPTLLLEKDNTMKLIIHHNRPPNSELTPLDNLVCQGFLINGKNSLSLVNPNNDITSTTHMQMPHHVGNLSQTSSYYESDRKHLHLWRCSGMKKQKIYHLRDSKEANIHEMPNPVQDSYSVASIQILRNMVHRSICQETQCICCDYAILSALKREKLLKVLIATLKIVISPEKIQEYIDKQKNMEVLRNHLVTSNIFKVFCIYFLHKMLNESLLNSNRAEKRLGFLDKRRFENDLFNTYFTTWILRWLVNTPLRKHFALSDHEQCMGFIKLIAKNMDMVIIKRCMQPEQRQILKDAEVLCALTGKPLGDSDDPVCALILYFEDGTPSVYLYCDVSFTMDKFIASTLVREIEYLNKSPI